ncbi:MAG: hypothetical protein N3C63_02225 [Rhodocyclaceae bacterium]|nr:hypothetical protein [Rhodocyclaceae bacterium]
MPGAFTASRLALTLRRWRGRFGIAAPEVAVRTKLPWYWRAIGWVAIIFLSVGLVEWAFDAGRRIAGFNRSETELELEALRAENLALKEEVGRLRGLLTASESNLQIERAAQQLLSEKNAALVQENAKLKEDIAVFERLSGRLGKPAGDVVLDRVTVRPEGGPGHYRYSFVLMLQGGRKGKESLFNLQLVALPRTPSGGAKIVLPTPDQQDKSQYEIVLKNFRRIEGKFALPAGFLPSAIEIRIYEAGILKASEVVSL